MIKYIISVMLVVLVGCQSAPVLVSYYLLTPPTAPAVVSASNEAKPVVVLERLELAEFLQQSGLLLQTGDNQLQVSRTHLWAEGLEQAFPRALLKSLQQQFPHYRFYMAGSDYVATIDYQLRMNVDGFQATDRGEAVLAGRFQLIAAGKGTEVRQAFYLTKPLLADGYPHAVQQLAALVDALASELGKSLQTMATAN